MKSLQSLKQEFKAQLDKTLSDLSATADQTKSLNLRKEQLIGAIYALETLESKYNAEAAPSTQQEEAQ